MLALTIWPSASESCHSFVIPHLDLGSSYCSSSVKCLERRKTLHMFHISNHSLFCLSSYFRGLSNGVLGRVDLFTKPKKGSLGTALALKWALEGTSVGNNLAKEELENSNGFLDKYDGSTNGCNDEDGNGEIDVDANDNDQNDDDGQKGEIDQKQRNGNSQRIDVRALALELISARTSDDVDKVLNEKGNFPLQLYSTLIRSFGKEKKLDPAMALFKWLKLKSNEGDDTLRPNHFIYNNLLEVIKHTEKFDVVEKVMNDMAAEGLCPNVVTYNTLMSIYIEQRREVEALQLFEEVQKKSVLPSSASYSIVLLAYRRLEDGFGALSFFVEIRSKYQKGEIGKDGGEEDWDNEFVKLENFIIRICYQVMRCWLVKSENQSIDVLRLLKEMDKAGLQTGRAEYERLVWACTREEHCVVAKELYARIREIDTEITISVCNHMIWLMGKAKKWWAALEIYDDLLDKGPKPNNMSYVLIVSHFNKLLTAARKRGIWKWGVRLLNKMEEKGLKPGSREWNSVLIACSKASETSAAVEIFNRMVEQGEKPTIISYGALLSALEKGKLYDEALKVWKHMIKVGVEPNLYAYTIMASIYASQGKFDIVNNIIREMVTVGIEPTVVTFNAIISSCARNNLGSAAYEWHEQMKLHNITPNEVTYEMLIEALANDGKPRLAYDLYVRAQKEGLELSSKAYDAVVQSSQLYGATINVFLLGPRPQSERKEKVQKRKHLSQFSHLADVPRISNPFDEREIYSSEIEELEM